MGFVVYYVYPVYGFKNAILLISFPLTITIKLQLTKTFLAFDLKFKVFAINYLQ